MNHQRGRLFVDPAFQGRLLARLAAYWFLYHFVLWHFLFLFSIFSHVVNPGSGKSGGLLDQYREFAIDHVSIIVCFVVTLPLITRDMLKFSHRMVGPLVRFREVMKQMIQGKAVSEVTLRPRDLPTDFLVVFNKLITTCNGRLAKPDAASDDNQLELAETM